MISSPPIKKGFHFASDGIHFAEFIEAESVQEAEALYHQVKRVMSPAATPAVAPAPQQSTAALQTAEETAS
jgi:hypothetical protein